MRADAETFRHPSFGTALPQIGLFSFSASVDAPFPAPFIGAVFSSQHKVIKPLLPFRHLLNGLVTDPSTSSSYALHALFQILPPPHPTTLL